MAFRDCRGVPVSTRNHDTLDRYETAVRLVHGYSNDAISVIDGALAHDPAFVMGHCLRAGLMVMSTDKTAEIQLRRSVESAEALWSGANLRERGHIAAARAWLGGDFERSVKLYGCVLSDYPRDSAALQFAHVGDLRACKVHMEPLLQSDSESPLTFAPTGSKSEKRTRRTKKPIFAVTSLCADL